MIGFGPEVLSNLFILYTNLIMSGREKIKRTSAIFESELSHLSEEVGFVPKNFELSQQDLQIYAYFAIQRSEFTYSLILGNSRKRV